MMSHFDVVMLAIVSWLIWLALWLALPLWLRGRKPTTVELWGAGVIAGSGVLVFLGVIVWRTA